MAEEERTRRWQKVTKTPVEADPIQLLRTAIAAVRTAPRDPEARRRLRAVAAEQGMWEQLALLLADEARAAAKRPEVAAAIFEELADVHENLDQPLETISAMEAVVELEPANVEHHNRLAWLYRKAGAWVKAAETFERVANLARDDRARAALRAAGKLYRDNGRLDRAVTMYQAIVTRRPSDVDAWRALDELLSELGRWRELAEVRGSLAAQTTSQIEKAVLLRAQARAFEQCGDNRAAAELVAKAADHAPEDVSGLVDHAVVLARAGRGREAADILAARVADAVARGAPAEDIAALRARHAGILEDACGDRPAAAAVLAELLAAVPDHLPALERLVWQASHDPDPRVHATALLRHAGALPDGADKISAVTEAARRLRDARDHRAAVRAFEKATELAPDDDQLRDELEDTRTTLAVERAGEEITAGDTASAERRLRTILGSRPVHLAANLALAELLVRTGRGGAAAEHLRATLEAAPDDVAPARLAPLVHRYAQVMAATGDADEAHQLLHEAHRLDRQNVAITLALGESCFARRLWREAALHLGSLAEHPEAARHAAGVAAGLVHAAQAEVRALRPANAHKRYEAAVALDPACAPAWHALAEAAIERGDMAHAAECLEREATATTEPKDRLRLFDALGDLALDVLGDALRAERCWTQVATAGHAPVLHKLLAVQRRRGAGLERAETCQRLAELATTPRAKKELTEEAAEAFAAAGDVARACDVAEQLIAAYPLDVDTVACASAVTLAAGDYDSAAAWLSRALASWDAAGNRGDRDPRRADLWRRLGDAERARGEERAAHVAYERAVATAPESDGAHAARRGLVDLAPVTGRPAAASLAVLVEADQDPVDVLAWARELARVDNADDARAAFELAQAVGARLEPDDERFLADHPARVMASDEAYAAPLADAERRALVDDDADAPLADVLEMLWEAAAMVCPNTKTALFEADLADATRVTPSSEVASAALYPQIANALGGPTTLLYASSRSARRDLMLLLASPPVIVIGPRLASVRARSQSDVGMVSDGELRYWLGRTVELARPHRVFAAGTDATAFELLVGGLCHAFGRRSEDSVPAAVIAEAERLHAALPVLLRKRITDRLAAIDPDSLDAHVYASGCARAADRAGLLACGHAGLAIDLAGGPIAARHLVRLAATPRYLAARRKLRSRRG